MGRLFIITVQMRASFLNILNKLFSRFIDRTKFPSDGVKDNLRLCRKQIIKWKKNKIKNTFLRTCCPSRTISRSPAAEHYQNLRIEGLTRLHEHRIELQHRLDIHGRTMEMPPSPSPSSRSLAPFSSASSSLSEGSNQPSGEDSASIVTGTQVFIHLFFSTLESDAQTNQHRPTYTHPDTRRQTKTHTRNTRTYKRRKHSRFLVQ